MPPPEPPDFTLELLTSAINEGSIGLQRFDELQDPAHVVDLRRGVAHAAIACVQRACAVAALEQCSRAARHTAPRACANLLAVTKGGCYVCMSSSELHTLQKAWLNAGGKWSTFVIWAKNSFTLGRADYQRQYEPILYGWKQGSDHFWCGDRNQADVWFYNKPRVNDLQILSTLIKRGFTQSREDYSLFFQKIEHGSIFVCLRRRYNY